MYEIHLKGNKKAVLLAWANAVGFVEPDILFEEGTDDSYIMHCEIETNWDSDPYPGESESYDGATVVLDDYSEEAIRNGEHSMCFEKYDAKNLSGYLNIEMEILNRPDDGANPFCDFYHFSSGKNVEYSRFKNPDFDEDVPDDIDEEELQDMFDEWHDFSF